LTIKPIGCLVLDADDGRGLGRQGDTEVVVPRRAQGSPRRDPDGSSVPAGIMGYPTRDVAVPAQAVTDLSEQNTA
jgi:hypothetical protein